MKRVLLCAVALLAICVHSLFGGAAAACAQQKFTAGGLVSSPLDNMGHAVLDTGGGFTASMYLPMRGTEYFQEHFVLGFDYIGLPDKSGVNFITTAGEDLVVDGADLYFLKPGIAWRVGGPDVQWFVDLTGIIGYGLTDFGLNPNPGTPNQTTFMIDQPINDAFMGGYQVASGVQFNVYNGYMAKVGMSYSNVFNKLFDNNMRHDAFLNGFLEINFGPPIRIFRR